LTLIPTNNCSETCGLTEKVRITLRLIKILFFILFLICQSRHSVLDESSVAFPETRGTRRRTDLCIFYSRGAIARFFHKNSGENHVLFLNISIPIGQQFVSGDKPSMARNLNLLGLT